MRQHCSIIVLCVGGIAAVVAKCMRVALAHNDSQRYRRHTPYVDCIEITARERACVVHTSYNGSRDHVKHGHRLIVHPVTDLEFRKRGSNCAQPLTAENQRAKLEFVAEIVYFFPVKITILLIFSSQNEKVHKHKKSE